MHSTHMNNTEFSNQVMTPNFTITVWTDADGEPTRSPNGEATQMTVHAATPAEAKAQAVRWGYSVLD